LALKLLESIGRGVTDAGLPEHVQGFLMAHIDSIEQLEVLLLLQARKEREWTAAEVALELRITKDSAATRMEDLSAGGLLTSNGGRPERYRYSPIRSDDVRAIAALAMAYSKLRVSVITFIFSKPQTRGHGLADAFFLKKRRDGRG
jgi:predicted ArsR family transcriptional regulator